MTIADVRVGLRAHLLADSAISAVVGGDRIYPVKLKQGEKRASIVYTRVSGQGDHHMQGASGLAQGRIQIGCWAPAIDAANVLANLVKSRIDGFKGSVLWGENSPEDAIIFQGIFFDGEREIWDEAAELYGVVRDYIAWHEEG